MSKSLMRRGAIGSAVAASLLVAVLIVAPSAEASKLYACVTKKGTARVFTKAPKCKKGEKKLSWNAAGVAGANGGNGANGANGKEGAPGQPQKAVKFSAAEESSFEPAPIALYSADGITYTFSCQFALFFTVGELQAHGSAGQSYASAVFGRPAGQETTTEDVKTLIDVVTIGGESQSVATDINAAANKGGSEEQYAIWTATIEGPSSITLLHVWMDTAPASGPTCKVHGTAITIPA